MTKEESRLGTILPFHRDRVQLKIRMDREFTSKKNGDKQAVS